MQTDKMRQFFNFFISITGKQPDGNAKHSMQMYCNFIKKMAGWHNED